MKRTLITTSDGSSTLKVEQWGETYHSIHGALQEALHVYIKNGFERVTKDSFSILEMGFGTGLNALLTLVQSQRTEKKVVYHAVEGFPLSVEEVKGLNYVKGSELESYEHDFELLHDVPWEQETGINDFFTLKKIKSQFEHMELNQKYDLIYFDVFGYPYQPDLWSLDMFIAMYALLSPGGLLVTYACRGVIKRAMKQAGFEIQVIQGPPGKREMLLAWRK